MGGGGKFETSKGIDRGIEKSGDPSALNEEESAVVEFFSESYNPGMPSGGSSGGYKDPKIEEAKKKAKLKLQKKIEIVKSIGKNNE